MNPRDAFVALARECDDRIALDRAALLIAAEEYPSLEIEAHQARLDELARGAAARLAGAASGAERVERLLQYLGVEQGFAGNRERYDDPRNHFLNDVLDRRQGIPISLSVVYIEVGRRLGLPLRGVGFPAHFLVKYDADGEEIVVDPFFAQVLSRAECERKLRELTHSDVALRPELHLRAASVREILVRMLRNLKQLYAHSRDWGRALGCSERILLLEPQAPLELRDRGLLYEQLECFGAAAADFARFLAIAPDDESAPAVGERLSLIQGRVRLLH